MAAEEEDPFATTRMTLGEHLEELRRRLFRGTVVVVIAFALAWGFREQIADIVMRPFGQTVGMLNADLVLDAEAKLAADPELSRAEFFFTDIKGEERLVERVDERPIATGIGEGFFFTLKTALYFALFLGGPFLLWELWQFVAAGLYGHEKKVVHRYFPFSILLFFTGVLFGYFLMVPYGMYYLATTGLGFERLRPEFKLDQYFTLITGLTLALGVIFQLPLVMVVITRLGLIEPKTMARYRAHYLVIALIVSALLTPPDPFTQMMMAVPSVILFEIGLIVSRITAREREAPAGESSSADASSEAGAASGEGT